jgi:CHAD domain-containing protein
MSSNGDDRAQLVHETRKTIKRMRAMARVLRPEIGERKWKRANTALREAGRRLARARDADVRIATLRDLRARHPDELADASVDALLARLEQPQPAARKPDPKPAPPKPSSEPAPPEPGPELAALADVAEVRRHLLRWNLLDHDADAIVAGLRSIYRDGRRRYQRVRRSRTDDPVRLHDWRKRVKSLYYALDTLGGKQLHATAKMTRRADRLGEVLGAEHDLWMLASFLPDEPELPARTRELLLALIEQRRVQLRKRALKLGARLYARKPARFAERAGRALTG